MEVSKPKTQTSFQFPNLKLVWGLGGGGGGYYPPPKPQTSLGLGREEGVTTPQTQNLPPLKPVSAAACPIKRNEADKLELDPWPSITGVRH